MSNPSYRASIARADDLLRRAAGRRRAREADRQPARLSLPMRLWRQPLQLRRRPRGPMLEGALTLRLAGDRDAAALARLAALDSSPPPAHAVLVADVGGELYAALSLSERAVVADPFRATAELIELMRTHARLLNRTLKPRRSKRVRPRLLLGRRVSAGAPRSTVPAPKQVSAGITR